MIIKSTQALVTEGYIPDWLGNNINHKCKCGFTIYNNVELTQRWCINLHCPYHMQHQGEEMFKYLGVKGIGAETCRKIIESYSLKNHFQLLPKLLPDHKPSVYLWEIGEMAAIKSFGKVFWETNLSSYWSFEEYFRSNNYHPDLLSSKDFLIEAQQYFKIKPPLSSTVITVMITGSINGYSNRDHFVIAINNTIGQYLRIQQKGKNQKVNFCICEDPHSQTPKARLAREQGIPIVSSKEFLDIISRLFQGTS